jgi:hypothetical protein
MRKKTGKFNGTKLYTMNYEATHGTLNWCFAYILVYLYAPYDEPRL